MIPFEALHPQEAFFLQNLYSRGFCVRGHADYPETLFVKPQRKPIRRKGPSKYSRIIAQIRLKPDVEL
jgi:hypothetical protein